MQSRQCTMSAINIHNEKDLYLWATTSLTSENKNKTTEKWENWTSSMHLKMHDGMCMLASYCKICVWKRIQVFKLRIKVLRFARDGV